MLVVDWTEKMSGTYEFAQLDVFTKTLLTGNPLAIFTDAREERPAFAKATAGGASLASAYFN